MRPDFYNITICELDLRRQYAVSELRSDEDFHFTNERHEFRRTGEDHIFLSIKVISKSDLYFGNYIILRCGIVVSKMIGNIIARDYLRCLDESLPNLGFVMRSSCNG